jgi:predicted membrane-bound dolichyl-phosphate-mannose-protein mannosyltransferase
LLEFSHPALAVSGLAAWTMFVLVHYRPLAWIAFGILLATMGAGLGWLTRNKVDRTRKAAAAWDFPLRLVVMHGLAAVLSITLTVLTALLAAHG